METEFIRQALQKLRADLMATNKALAAVASTLTDEQRDQALRRFALTSLLHEETAAGAAKQVAPETLQAMREAEERAYALLLSAKATPHG